MSFAVHLKLTQYCKSSILQLKKKGEREERGEEREERKLEREKKRKEERKSFVSTLVVWNRPWYIYTIISHGLSIYTMYLADAVYQFFHFFFLFSPKEMIVSYLPAQYWFYRSQCSYVWKNFWNSPDSKWSDWWISLWMNYWFLIKFYPCFSTLVILQKAGFHIPKYYPLQSHRHIFPEWHFQHIVFLLPYLILLFVWTLGLKPSLQFSVSLHPTLCSSQMSQLANAIFFCP